MQINEFINAGLQQSFDMLKMHLGDLSDADLLTRPVPNANHPNWQIGHLIASENGMMTQAGAKMPELPAGFAKRYEKETAKLDGQANFATKADLLALFEKTRAGTIAWTKTLTQAQLDGPSPMPEWFPNLAGFINLGAIHIAMHLGQISVLRRKLGKPVVM